MTHRFWFSEKQRRVCEWSDGLFDGFGFNPPGMTSRPYLVESVNGETIEIGYTEWTTGDNSKSNWDDAVLVAEYDHEPKVVIRWHEIAKRRLI